MSHQLLPVDLRERAFRREEADGLLLKANGRVFSSYFQICIPRQEMKYGAEVAS